jgi:hypothetical protein
MTDLWILLISAQNSENGIVKIINIARGDYKRKEGGDSY